MWAEYLDVPVSFKCGEEEMKNQLFFKFMKSVVFHFKKFIFFTMCIEILIDWNGYQNYKGQLMTKCYLLHIIGPERQKKISVKL